MFKCFFFIIWNKDIETPLLLLVYRFGRLDVAKFLIEKGCQWNVTDKRSRSPLWYASYWGREEIVQFLLDLGADANEQDEDGDGPLHMAVSALREDSGNLKVVKA